jgi:hypothetical protein
MIDAIPRLTIVVLFLRKEFSVGTGGGAALKPEGVDFARSFGIPPKLNSLHQ